MSEIKDYYKILEINYTADENDIKKAFRKLAKKYHPDINKDELAIEKFKLINEAYDILSDSVKRKNYDIEYSKKNSIYENKTPYYEGGEFDGDSFSFDDEIESMFKARGFGNNIDPEFGDMNIEVEIFINIFESINGCTKKISIKDSYGKTEILEVNIPKGISDGEKIRFKGRGRTINGKSGNLYVKVKIKNENIKNDFERIGNDILLRVKVPFVTCALGGNIVVKTLDGKVSVNIKEGTQDGTRIRLKGKGIKDLKNSSIIGDEIIIIEIDVPKDLSIMAKRKLMEFQNLI